MRGEQDHALDAPAADVTVEKVSLSLPWHRATSVIVTGVGGARTRVQCRHEQKGGEDMKQERTVGRWHRGLGAALALTLLAAVPARGQDGATFVSLGPVGLGEGSSGTLGYAVHVAAGHAFGRQVLSLRGAAVLQDADFLWDDVWDIALVYGQAFRGRESFSTVGAGVGYVGGSLLGESGRTLGLALEAQTSFRAGPVGLGVYAFANLNNRQSFVGATLALRFGGF